MRHAQAWIRLLAWNLRRHRRVVNIGCYRDQTHAARLDLEDELLIAMHIAHVAEEVGCEIVGVAGDELQAIAIAREAKPDLILADVDLGTGGNGIAAVRQIEHQAQVPSIVITGNAEPVDHGIRRLVAVIGKPFEECKLKDLIKRAVSSCFPIASVASNLSKPRIAEPVRSLRGYHP